MNLLYVIFGIGLVSFLATVILLWLAAMTAPIRKDWESSLDERYRRRFGSVDQAPDMVPEDIMELPALYREPVDYDG